MLDLMKGKVNNYFAQHLVPMRELLSINWCMPGKAILRMSNLDQPFKVSYLPLKYSSGSPSLTVQFSTSPTKIEWSPAS